MCFTARWKQEKGHPGRLVSSSSRKQQQVNVLCEFGSASLACPPRMCVLRDHHSLFSAEQCEFAYWLFSSPAPRTQIMCTAFEVRFPLKMYPKLHMQNSAVAALPVGSLKFASARCDAPIPSLSFHLLPSPQKLIAILLVNRVEGATSEQDRSKSATAAQGVVGHHQRSRKWQNAASRAARRANLP